MEHLEKLLATIGLTGSFSCLYFSSSIPWNCTYLEFMAISYVVFFNTYLFLKLALQATSLVKKSVQAIPTLTLETFKNAVNLIFSGFKYIFRTIAQELNRVNNKLVIITWLLRKNRTLSMKVESLKAELHETTLELKTVVNCWTPKSTSESTPVKKTGAFKLSLPTLSQYGFIEKKSQRPAKNPAMSSADYDFDGLP